MPELAALLASGRCSCVLARRRPQQHLAGMDKPLQTYETRGITVTFDPNICSHSGVCVRGLPAVFDIKRKHWVRPELDTPEAVAAQVARCPSGALQSRLPGSQAS